MRRLPPAARTFAPLAATLLAVSTLATTPARADTQGATSKLATPDKFLSVTGLRGPHPGETTIKSFCASRSAS